MFLSAGFKASLFGPAAASTVSGGGAGPLERLPMAKDDANLGADDRFRPSDHWTGLSRE